MSTIPLYLPPEAKVIGALRDRSHLWSMDQDMLSIELPGPIFITVGWYPDLDPNGEYRVEVFNESPDKLHEPRFRSRDVGKVECKVYELVRKYLLGLAASGSGDNSISRALNGQTEIPVDVVDASSESLTSDLKMAV